MKLHSYGLSVTDVLSAISQQNVIVSPGRTGDEPATSSQEVTYPITVKGQLSSVEEFRNITIKSQVSAARVTLADVARVESGLQSYAFGIRENGVPATAAAIQLSPGANAISTASGIRARLTELSGVLPEGMTFTVPFDTAPFVKLSILKVVETFVEAMVLVFFVMLLFLHKIRCTLIPAIVAPVALLGTFTVMLLSGYSINILTMFGMILAIGIIVDDAIVVVENVERLMEDKKCLHRMQREKRCVKLRRQSLVLRWCSLRCLYQWPLPAVLWVLFIDSSAFRWRYPFTVGIPGADVNACALCNPAQTTWYSSG